MTARLHALSLPHFQAQTDTPARIVSLIIIPGNMRSGAVEHRGICRWPLPRSSSTWGMDWRAMAARQWGFSISH